MKKIRYFVIFIILASFTSSSLVDESFSEEFPPPGLENCEPPMNCGINPIKEPEKIIENPINNNPVTENNNYNNRCSGDCIGPTFYKNKAGVPIVKDGFIFNGNSTDVTGYHTPYPLITVNTNETHNIKLKVYEKNQLRWFQIGFGMHEIGVPFNDAESLATFYINFQNDTLDRVEKVDKHSLIDILNATVNKVPCGYDDLECYELSVDFVARDQLINNIIGIHAVDWVRRSTAHSINDGIEVVGESMNEQLLQNVGAHKGGPFYPLDRGSVELKQIDYKTDTWQDKYGYLWTGDNNKSFKIISQIPVPIPAPDKITSIIDRNHSEFQKMIDYEIERAMKYYNATYR